MRGKTDAGEKSRMKGILVVIVVNAVMDTFWVLPQKETQTQENHKTV